MAQPVFERQDEPSGWIFFGLLALSVVAHGVTFVVLPDTPPARAAYQPVEMEFYEPPPPPKVEEPKPEEPPKPLDPPKVKLKVIAKAEAPPPKEEAPPPPNQEPPPETPQEPVPIVIGVTMESTTATGGFAVQVGNTTYGKASDKVVDPSQVKAYAAPKYVPPGSADSEPVAIGEKIDIPYPEEARKNEIEGRVRLQVTIDETGSVIKVVLQSGLGYGLDEATIAAIKKSRWKPATKNGEPVIYTIPYSFLFELN